MCRCCKPSRRRVPRACCPSRSPPWHSSIRRPAASKALALAVGLCMAAARRPWMLRQPLLVCDAYAGSLLSRLPSLSSHLLELCMAAVADSSSTCLHRSAAAKWSATVQYMQQTEGVGALRCTTGLCLQPSAEQQQPQATLCCCRSRPRQAQSQQSLQKQSQRPLARWVCSWARRTAVSPRTEQTAATSLQLTRFHSQVSTLLWVWLPDQPSQAEYAPWQPSCSYGVVNNVQPFLAIPTTVTHPRTRQQANSLLVPRRSAQGGAAAGQLAALEVEGFPT